MTNSRRNKLDIFSKEDIENCNVAVYFSMSSMSPIVELHAAMVRDLLNRGNNVTVYICDQSFKSPTENPFNRKSIYKFALFRAMDAVQGLSVKIKIINLNDISEHTSAKTKDSLSIGVLSSIASATKAQTKQELNRRWLKVYKNMLHSAQKLYNYFLKEIDDQKYDFFFMFNGRFGCTKPALEAARDCKIGFGLYEVKKSVNEVVFVNELVHSISGNTKRALSYFEEDKQRATKNAQKFFERKIKNEDTGEPIYTRIQKKGILPAKVVQSSRQIIAIYPTTEDEYKFIGLEWDGYVPQSQVQEIDDLAANLEEQKYLLVVKMHPNQANSAENTLGKYKNLEKKHSHVVVEEPLSRVDSYALMSVADVVLTFASTIGVEACYARKPVVLIGDTTWSNMNVAHKVHLGKEAAEIIKRGVTLKPQLGAIIWGNYLFSYSDNLPAYKRVSNGNFCVDGRKIGHSSLRRILQLPAKLEIEISKPGFKINRIFLKRLQNVFKNIVRGKWAIQ